MKQKFRAYASWLRMFKDEFPFKSDGKLAILWFDEIILQVRDKKDILSAIEVVAEEQDWNTSTLREFRRLLVPVTKYQPKYRLLPNNPWQSKNRSLVDTAWRITVEETKKMEPNVTEGDPGFRHEVAWAGAGLIESVSLWLVLNTQNHCSFLPESREHKVLQELFSSATKKEPLDIFSEIMTYKIGDLRFLSWDEIIQLRRHTFFDEFRRKMVELHMMLDSEDSKSIQQLVDEILHMGKEEALRLFRPSSSRKLLIKTIASNIPMPIPINPASVLFGVKDLYEGLDHSKNYGWMYFLLDLERKN